MAKNVDLTSREWRDLIFEGKNKEFGAYQMRKTSEARHNKAMIAVLIFAAVMLFICGITYYAVAKSVKQTGYNQNQL